MYFIGVTTAGSSIMRVFESWASALDLDAAIEGIDVPIGAPADHYRRIVDFLQTEPFARGALITAHKLDLYRAAADKFDLLDPSAVLTGEISCVVSDGAQLAGYAKDLVTGGLAIEEVASKRAPCAAREALLMGAGGATVAITCHLLGQLTPTFTSIIITDIHSDRLDHIERVHRDLSHSGSVIYDLVRTSEDNDALIAGLSPGAVIVNATGMGKDTPGAPITGVVRFPPESTVWDLNYRGDLEFLQIARAASSSLGVSAVDGWLYFIHGWLQTIGTIFGREVPTSGPEFDELARLAANERTP